MEKKEQLKSLRKELFVLQEKFLDLLCTDGEGPETRLEQAFCHLLYEVDTELRKIK